MRKNPTFTLIDGLRGIAALAVFAFHSVKATGNSFWPASGYLAVDLFFLLSGMVIAYSYDQRIASKELGIPGFLLIRIIRFYPLYFIGAVLAALLAIYSIRTGRNVSLSSTSHVLEALGLTLLFLPQKIGNADGLFPLIVPYWSLFFELVINAVFIVLWPWLSRRVLVGIVVTSGLALAFFAHTDLALAAGNTWATVPLGLARVSFSFFLGVTIVRNMPRRESESDWVAFVSIFALGALFFIQPGSLRYVYDVACALLIFPLFGLLAMRYQVGRLSAPLAKTVGDASYGVYALHAPLNGLTFGVLAIVGLPVGHWQPWSFLVIAFFVIGCVLLLDRYLDRPARKWLTSRTRRREPAAI